MRKTKQAIAALAVFALAQGAVLLATGLAPRAVEAHAEITDTERDRPGRIHRPEAPTNLRAEGAPGRTHNAIVVSWDAGHDHTERLDYYRATDSTWIETWLTLYTSPLPTTAGSFDRCLSRRGDAPDGCIRRSVAPGSASYSETVTGLTPETTYYVHVAAADYSDGPAVSDGATVMFTTTAGTGTPDPTTPDPETPGCTYEHRLTGVPATTGAGYTSQILVTSKGTGATATLRAYQASDGTPIDVLDSEGAAVGASTSLAPANSVKVFRLEAIRGWHTVIVTHPTKAAMENATVAVRIRQPDTGVTVDHVTGIERCITGSPTTQ